jgi:hypothetical protein
MLASGNMSDIRSGHPAYALETMAHYTGFYLNFFKLY